MVFAVWRAALSRASAFSSAGSMAPTTLSVISLASRWLLQGDKFIYGNPAIEGRSCPRRSDTSVEGRGSRASL
jgi:hypothetical protein